MFLSLKRGFALLSVLCLCAITPGCSDDSTSPAGSICPSPDVQPAVITFTSSEYYAVLAGGDREFDGNGPKVKFVAYHYVRGENSDSLICGVSFIAMEHGGGNSNAWADGEACVYVAPNGWRIINVGTEPCTAEAYASTKLWHEINSGNWTFHWVGDTEGDDIGSGSPCTSCTRFYFQFISTVAIEEL